MCLLASRTAESSSKETQEDVHCENGRDEEPVEEYRRALRKLVSVCLRVFALRKLFGHLRVKVNMCVWEDLKSEREGKRIKGVRVCACMSVQGEAMPVRHAILCSRDAAINLEARYSIDQLALSAFCPSIFVPLYLSVSGGIPPLHLHLRPHLRLGRPSFSSAPGHGVPDSLSQHKFYMSCVLMKH